MKTDTTNLISAMYELARAVQSRDGVAKEEIYEAIFEAAERLGLQHAEIARLTKQNEAYAGLSKAREWQLSFHRAKADEYRVAVDSLESERAANAHLTAEVARMTAECDMLKGEAAVLKILLRDADEVLAVVEADDCDEDESMMKLRMAIAGSIAHKLPCGECHLKDGERCDICGAVLATDIRARGSQ